MVVIIVADTAVFILSAIMMTMATTMLTAIVCVVITLCIRVVCKGAGKQCFYRIVRSSLNTTIKFDLGFFQRVSRAIADTSANQSIDLMLL